MIPNSVTSIGQAAFSDVTKIIVEEGNERYDSRQNDAQGNGSRGGFKAHVQKGRGEGSCPGPGAGNRDADKQQQRHKQAASARPALKLLSGVAPMIIWVLCPAGTKRDCVLIPIFCKKLDGKKSLSCKFSF